MSRKHEGLLELLVKLPWWASVIAAALAFVGMRWVAQAFAFDNVILRAAASSLHSIAPYIALLLLVPLPFSLWRSSNRRQLLDSQSGIDSIRALPWPQFERLVGEAFRRQGYSVSEHGGAAPDGGIDLIATRAGEKLVVQCKHWRMRRVGVGPVRELGGVAATKRATKAVLVTSGAFTDEAHSFANLAGIELIGGPELVRLIGSGNGVPESHSQEAAVAAGIPSCPTCGAPMVKRVAKAGSRAGQSFWGCAAFPSCRGTRTA